MLPEFLFPEGTVGLRSPNHPICIDLLGLCNGILVGTSANRGGRPPAISAKQAFEELGDQVDIILDGGKPALALRPQLSTLRSLQLRSPAEGPSGKGRTLALPKNACVR